ncbi:MAG TPA: cytochrome c [Acetobacteraceae bacterium]|nr:cytochrome c [Acetobacteraceae bacterium]
MRRLLFLSLFLVASPALAQAPGITVPADTLIAARQSNFLLSEGTFMGMKNAIADKEDVTVWADAAGFLANWAGTLPSLFPPGTEKGHDTKALAAVWTDRAGFEKAATRYGDAAKKLQAAAKSGDKAAFAAAFKETGKACGACHKKFRQKDED